MLPAGPAEEPPIIPPESFWVEHPASRTPAADSATITRAELLVRIRLSTLPSYTPWGISAPRRMLTAGQAGDNPMLGTLAQALGERGTNPHFRLLADDARSHPNTRAFLRGRRIKQWRGLATGYDSRP